MTYFEKMAQAFQDELRKIAGPEVTAPLLGRAAWKGAKWVLPGAVAYKVGETGLRRYRTGAEYERMQRQQAGYGS